MTFGPVINRRRITPREYDAIRGRLRVLGKSEEAVQTIAAEFNRGVSTIDKLKARA